MKTSSKDASIVVGVALAFILWYFVFITDVFGDFWLRITPASLGLALYAAYSSGASFRDSFSFSASKVAKGAGYGLLLYGLFFVGFNVFRPLLEEGASNVYLIRTEGRLFLPAATLLVTSYCEEFFWRRTVQRGLVERYGWAGFAAALAAYGLIHVPTGNVPLVFAALIAGLYWGLLIRFNVSFEAVVVSHIVWTELIFVFLPLR